VASEKNSVLKEENSDNELEKTAGQASSQVASMVESLKNKFHGKEGSNDGQSMSSDEEVDLFSVPMNSEAFMAKIAE
jgi:hypothetical protein